MLFLQTNLWYFVFFFLSIFFLASFLFSVYRRAMKEEYFSVYEKRRTLALGMFTLSFLFLFFILLKPVLLFESQKILQGGNLVFAVDVSKSMNARDVDNGKKPRLDLVKETIEKIILKSPSSRYALTVFAGDSLRILPFTSDANIFSTFLNGISYTSVSRQGTNIDEALASAYANFTPETQGGTIILFTDGGEDEISFQEKQEWEKDRNVNIIVVGVGTEEGAYIPEGTDFFGQIRYKTYKGTSVVTKLEKDILNSIAGSLDGASFFLSETSQSDALMSLIREKLYETDILLTTSRTGLDRFFIILAFVFFLISLFLTFSNHRKLG